jgi:oligopeptide/dipeptide ABC transporter ATP-binding protein
MPPKQPLLEIKNLKKHFPVRRGLFGRSTESVKAVDGISFDIGVGETLALVGESGCGKSTTGRLIMRSYPATDGEIVLRDEDGVWPLHALDVRQQKPVRRKIQMVFQDPFSALSPRMTVFDIVGEPLVLNGVGDRRARERRVRELIDLVGLSRQHLTRYPHAFSGGQRQRIGIARALALNPKLVVADEPVSSLDVSVQAQILNLLRDLQRELNLSYLFISHDLRVVDHLSHRVAVMYAGHLVEIGPTQATFAAPSHPYTAVLVGSIPSPVPNRGVEEIDLTGEVPDLARLPPGCAFHPRCRHATDICRGQRPELRQRPAAGGPPRWVACHHADTLNLRGIGSSVDEGRVDASVGVNRMAGTDGGARLEKGGLDNAKA